MPLPEGVTLKSGRSTEGNFIGKYVKIPLDEESKETLEGSELLKRVLIVHNVIFFYYLIIKLKFHTPDPETFN